MCSPSVSDNSSNGLFSTCISISTAPCYSSFTVRRIFAVFRSLFKRMVKCGRRLFLTLCFASKSDCCYGSWWFLASLFSWSRTIISSVWSCPRAQPNSQYLELYCQSLGSIFYWMKEGSGRGPCRLRVPPPYYLLMPSTKFFFVSFLVTCYLIN